MANIGAGGPGIMDQTEDDVFGGGEDDNGPQVSVVLRERVRITRTPSFCWRLGASAGSRAAAKDPCHLHPTAGWWRPEPGLHRCMCLLAQLSGRAGAWALCSRLTGHTRPRMCRRIGVFSQAKSACFWKGISMCQGCPPCGKQLVGISAGISGERPPHLMPCPPSRAV